MLARGLTAFDLQGSFSGIAKQYRRFSPLWGAMIISAPALCHNFVSLPEDTSASRVTEWGFGASAACARELFRCVGPQSVRPTNSRSQAAFHLGPHQLGQMVGLAARGAAGPAVVEALESHAIRSNKVRGVWTGVSMARYLRLYGYIADALSADPEPAALAFVARFMWERAETRLDLEAYLKGLCSGLQIGSIYEDGWSGQRISAPVGGGIDFRRAVLSDSVPGVQRASGDAQLLEVVAAKLVYSSCAKPPVKMRKQRPAASASPNVKAVTDCVEVAIREICEYVAIDVIRAGGLSELCGGPLPQLMCHAGLLDADEVIREAQTVSSRLAKEDLAPMPEAELASRWFDILQNLGATHHAKFLSRDEDRNVGYELWPSLANVSLLAACLLEPSVSPLSWRGSLEPLQKWGVRVDVTERRYRTAGSTSDQRTQQIVFLRSSRQAAALEVELETLHHMAKVTHTAPPASWMAWKQYFAEGGSLDMPMAWAIEAAVAPDARLTSRTPRHGPITVKHALQGVAWSRRRAAYDLWNPLDADRHVADRAYTVNASEEKECGARCVAAIRLLASALPNSAAEPLCKWVALDAPSGSFVNEFDLGEALQQFPALRSMLAEHRGSPLLVGQVSVGDLVRHPQLGYRKLLHLLS